MSLLVVGCSEAAPADDETAPANDEATIPADPADEVVEITAALHTLVGATWAAQGPVPILDGNSNTVPAAARNPVNGAGHALAIHPTNPTQTQ